MAPRLPLPEEAFDGLEIARHSLDQSIAHHLRELIVRGEIAPGKRLNLPELAIGFGVSTTPLREALKILAEEEIVEWSPGRGARVAPIRIDETEALFEVIASLEALAAEKAATRATTSELAELETLHARMRGHFEAGERSPYFELNTRIHERVLALADNAVLRAEHARLQVRARRGRYLAIADAARWREAMREHEELMQAIKGRDGARAHEVWRLHLVHTGAAVRRLQCEEKTGI
jgi:DNA-binding GntR family transcriptional regulator